MSAGAQSDVLQAGLLAAVPLRMIQLRGMGSREREQTVARWAADAVEPIASRGDALQYGGRKGQAADVFNHLARGLAALAQAPGGVLFAGVHWCVEHSGGVLRPTAVGLTCTASGVDLAAAVTVVVDRPVVTVRLDGVS